MRCKRIFFQTKVVTHQKPQLLSYVTFFDILRHFGVIAGSQICSVSVSRKYCGVLGNRFFAFSTIQSREKALYWSKKTTSRFWWISTFWGLLSPKKSFLACHLCVCVFVCLSVFEHYNSKNNYVSSTKFDVRSHMIKISAVIAFSKIDSQDWPLLWQHNSVFWWKVS